MFHKVLKFEFHKLKKETKEVERVALWKAHIETYNTQEFLNE